MEDCIGKVKYLQGTNFQCLIAAVCFLAVWSPQCGLAREIRTSFVLSAGCLGWLIPLDQYESGMNSQDPDDVVVEEVPKCAWCLFLGTCSGLVEGKNTRNLWNLVSLRLTTIVSMVLYRIFPATNLFKRLKVITKLAWIYIGLLDGYYCW